MRLCLALLLSVSGCAHLKPDTTPPEAPQGRYGVPVHGDLIESSSADLNVHLDIPVFDTLPEPGRDALNAEVRQNATDALADMQVQVAADIPELRANGFTSAYDVSSGYSVTFVNTRYLCFDQWISVYTGGAHPNTALRTYTIDLTDGSKVALPDLFKSPDEALLRLQAQVRTKLRSTDFFEEAGSTWAITPSALFRFDAEGLVLTFQQYEVAPYASGFPEVTLPWSTLDLAAKRDLPPVQRANE